MKLEEFDVMAVDGHLEMWCPEFGRDCPGPEAAVGRGTLGQLVVAAQLHLRHYHPEAPVAILAVPVTP